MWRMWSNAKVFVLMAGLTALLGVIGQGIGGQASLAVAIGFAAVTNIAMYFWSSRLVLRMYGAQVVIEREAPELYRMVDTLRQRAGLPVPTVAIAPHAQVNPLAAHGSAIARWFSTHPPAGERIARLRAMAGPSPLLRAA